MKTIILYGELAKRFGKQHKFAVKSVAESIRALRANFKDFEQFMCGAHHDQMGFKVFVGGHSLQDASELHTPSSQKDIIRIVPVVMGSGAFGRFLIGAVLVGASFLLPGMGVALSATVASAMFSVGASLVIGGVAQMLSSPPSTQKQAERRQSSIFNGPVNTNIQGGAIPIGYGRLIIGSVVISAGIETDES